MARSEQSGSGLSTAEVEDRTRRGLVNGEPEGPGRSVRDIVRANVFTRFNAILGALLLVIVVVGPFQDALFGVVLVLNTMIGIAQELRARSTLARLRLVKAARVRVLRDGRITEVPVAAVVKDDVVDLGPGDQLPADGVVIDGDFEVDESLLTGEADPVPKAPGDKVLSGSFVVAGSGRFVATGVGRDALAFSLTIEARQFSLTRSELRSGIDRILLMVQWAIVPTAVLLVISQLRSQGLADALRSSVAGVGAMVPEGLVLLTSVAFSVAVVRLGRKRVLAQELHAVEGLARVDVVCVDKTGTLTEGRMAVTAVEVLDGATDVDDALAALATVEQHPNPTLQAIGAWCQSSPGWTVVARVPFSSARKWAAATFEEHGTWVLGAPEVLLPPGAPATDRAASLAAAGDRVLVVARAAGLGGEGAASEDTAEATAIPADVVPAGLVILQEQVRADAAATVAYFAAEGVAVKVISGDSPVTVSAIARRVGLPGADAPVDARTLPDDPELLGQAMDAGTVFGRVSPRQKRAMVAALRKRGHVVAMTGDGVNDVVALKEADLGMAMGSGSDAARAVAQLVLLDDDFSVMPSVVGEGRQVIANVERVANLFVTKTVYAMLLALAVGAARLPFPFLPRHLTLISSLTIGIPAFFLALAPNHRRFRPGFVGRVLLFAVPAGLVAAASTFGAYAVARRQPNVTLLEARTTATAVLFAIGLWVLVILERPLTLPRRGLAAAMAVLFALAVLVPASRTFFALQVPPVVDVLAAIGVGTIGILVLDVGWRAAGWISRWWASRQGLEPAQEAAPEDRDLRP